jgi:ribose transport system substrate-binding protein
MLSTNRLGGLLAAAVLLAACGGPGSPTSSPGSPSVAPTSTAANPTATPPAVACDPASALADLEANVLSKGPNGEDPTSPSDISLTDAELTQIQGMNATAAIVMHYGGNDWSQAQIAGLNQQFDAMGIEVVATTDANFKPEQQVSDIETVMALNPDIIVSIPTDPVATEAAYRAAADAGVKLVFMDNVPKNFTAGTDYVASVSADNFGNGVAAAHLMAQALNCQGKVGIVYHEADFFVTRQRYDAFKQTITDDYPAIQIVKETGITGPDFTGDAETAASAMLTQYPDLDGIWAVWDVPAEGVVASARTANRDDLVITTIDLGLNVAILIAKNELVYGLGAQRPFDQGINEAILAGYGLLDKEAPPYVALPALPVMHDNVLDAWRAVYHADPPADLATAAQ